MLPLHQLMVLIKRCEHFLATVSLSVTGELVVICLPGRWLIGKPVLTVSDMNGNPVKGMDGNDLGPISLSDIPEGGSKSIAFDPGADGKARGNISIEQGTHGGQLYHASSHGHSELVSFNGGHLSGHSVLLWIVACALT